MLSWRTDRFTHHDRSDHPRRRALVLSRAGRTAVLVLHGFTGNPQSMRPLAKRSPTPGSRSRCRCCPVMARRSRTCWHRVARLVGCGRGAYARASAERAERSSSRGSPWAVRSPPGWAVAIPEIAGFVFINALATEPPGIRDLVQGMIDAGETVMDAIGSDIADPEVQEQSYDGTPLRPLASMFEATDELAVSAADHRPGAGVQQPAGPRGADHRQRLIAATVQGPVERLRMERSFHVATLDYDHELIETTAVAFAKRVTAS